MQEENPSARYEAVEQAVDVRITLPPQLPQFALQVLDQRLARLDVAHPQLLDRPEEARPRLLIETVQERRDRAVTLHRGVENDRPVPICHSSSVEYTDFSISGRGLSTTNSVERPRV